LSHEFINDNYSLGEILFDRLYTDIYKFIPTFLFLRDLIFEKKELKTIYKNISFLQINNFIFIIEKKVNKCPIITNVETEVLSPELVYHETVLSSYSFTGEDIFSEEYYYEWNTYYILNVYKDNSPYNRIINGFDKFVLPLSKSVYYPKKYIKSIITNKNNYIRLLILSEINNFLIIKKILKSKIIPIKKLYNIPEVLFLEIIDYIF
jgi:hypothetical protein